MLLSCFTHRGVVHLGLNMAALWGSADALLNTLGNKEQVWAAYISTGVIASWSTIIFDLTMKHLRGRPMRTCIGASGAIMGVITAAILSSPGETYMRFVVLPDTRFSGENFLQGFMLFDLLGIVVGGSGIAHAAHLGGMFGGYLFVKAGVHEGLGTQKYLLGQGDSAVIPTYQRAVLKHYLVLRHRLKQAAEDASL